MAALAGPLLVVGAGGGIAWWLTDRALTQAQAELTEARGRADEGVDSLSRAKGAAFAAYQKEVVSLFEVLQADDNLCAPPICEHKRNPNPRARRSLPSRRSEAYGNRRNPGR
jgi:hypothetical protein